MQLTKIQIDQVDFPDFFSSSGDFVVENGQYSKNIELSDSFTGDFEFSGKFSINGYEIEESFFEVKDNLSLFESFDDWAENSSGNIFLGTEQSLQAKNTNKNFLANTKRVSLKQGKQKNTIIGLKDSYFLNVDDSVLIFGKNSTIDSSRIKSNSIVFDFDNGNYFDSDVVFLDDVTTNFLDLRDLNADSLSTNTIDISGYSRVNNCTSNGFVDFSAGSWVYDILEISGDAKIKNNNLESLILTKEWVNSQGYSTGASFESTGLNNLNVSGNISVLSGGEGAVRLGSLNFDTGTISVPTSRISQLQNKKTFISGKFLTNSIIYIDEDINIYGTGLDPENLNNTEVATRDWVTGKQYLTGETFASGKNLYFQDDLYLDSDSYLDNLNILNDYYSDQDSGVFIYSNQLKTNNNENISAETLQVSGSVYHTGILNIKAANVLQLNNNAEISNLRVYNGGELNVLSSSTLTGSNIATESWLLDNYGQSNINDITITGLQVSGQVNVGGNTSISTLNSLSEFESGVYVKPLITGGEVTINNFVCNTDTEIFEVGLDFPNVPLSGYDKHSFVGVSECSINNIESGSIWNTGFNGESAVTSFNVSSNIVLPNPKQNNAYQPVGAKVDNVNVDGFKVSPKPKAIKINKILGSKQQDDYDDSYMRVADLQSKNQDWVFESPFYKAENRSKYMGFWLEILSKDNPYLSWTPFNRVMPTAKNINLFWRLFGYWQSWINFSTEKPIVSSYVEKYLNLIYDKETKLNAAGQSSFAYETVFSDLFVNQSKRANEDDDMVDWDQSSFDNYKSLLYSCYQGNMYYDLEQVYSQWDAYDNATYNYFNWSDILYGNIGGQEVFYMSFPTAYIPQSDKDVEINSSQELVYSKEFRYNADIDGWADYRADIQRTVRPSFRQFSAQETLNPNKKYVTIGTDSFSDFYTIDSILKKTSNVFMSSFPTVLNAGVPWQQNTPDSYKYDGGGWNNGPIHNRVFQDSELIPENIEDMTWEP